MTYPKVIMVRAEEQLHRRLKHEAARRGIGMSSLTRMIIIEWMSTQEGTFSGLKPLPPTEGTS